MACQRDRFGRIPSDDCHCVSVTETGQRFPLYWYLSGCHTNACLLSNLSSWQRDVPFLLNHLGLFLAMTTATLGNADMQRLKMITEVGKPEWRAMTQDGAIREMPLAIELKRFIMETYDDGSPKRFASDIQILTKSRKNMQVTIDVNKPAEVDGWKIYQYGYDTEMGAMSQISILELVSDPWLPLVYTGIYMMLGGAVSMFILGGRRKRV